MKQFKLITPTRALVGGIVLLSVTFSVSLMVVYGTEPAASKGGTNSIEATSEVGEMKNPFLHPYVSFREPQILPQSIAHNLLFGTRQVQAMDRNAKLQGSRE